MAGRPASAKGIGERGGDLRAVLSRAHPFANMAIALGRFVRFIRSIIVPTTTIIAFSCLLTFFFVLYQPTRGPGDLQRLGWQSWDIISPSSTGDSPNDVDHQSSDQPPPTSGDHDADVDWWNVTASATGSPIDSASLPLDVWAPLLPHDTGCTSFPLSPDV